MQKKKNKSLNREELKQKDVILQNMRNVEIQNLKMCETIIEARKALKNINDLTEKIYKVREDLFEKSKFKNINRTTTCKKCGKKFFPYYRLNGFCSSCNVYLDSLKVSKSKVINNF